ncbi:hypothetical protein LUZ60_016031 [Juncus effusus]|nr:hypothetical protein LUZ60_016031 [Juncus effusus]
MVKNLSLTSLFYKKNTKDTNRPWPSSKEQIKANSIKDTSIYRNTLSIYEKVRDSSERIDLTKSDRLLFKSVYFSNSIMEEAIVKPIKYRANFASNFKGGVAMEMESKDPHRDFRESMEEMVKAYGIKDLDWLEEMLGWYLRANGKKTHGIILGAFVDLLVGLTSSNPNYCNNLSNYPVSSSSSCSCFSFEVEEGMERK